MSAESQSLLSGTAPFDDLLLEYGEAQRELGNAGHDGWLNPKLTDRVAAARLALEEYVERMHQKIASLEILTKCVEGGVPIVTRYTEEYNQVAILAATLLCELNRAEEPRFTVKPISIPEIVNAAPRPFSPPTPSPLTIDQAGKILDEYFAGRSTEYGEAKTQEGT